MSPHLRVCVVERDRGSWDACASVRCCAGCAPASVILRWAADGNWGMSLHLVVPVAAAGR